MVDHPIQSLMKTTLENLKQMVDVNTIIGDPVETPDGSVILPVSKVGFGFAAGGSEFEYSRDYHVHQTDHHPFGGGSGGGVSISPIAFLVVSNGTVNVVPLDHQAHIAERLIELVPRLVDQLQAMFRGRRTEPMPVQPANAPVGDINRMM